MNNATNDSTSYEIVQAEDHSLDGTDPDQPLRAYGREVRP